MKYLKTNDIYGMVYKGGEEMAKRKPVKKKKDKKIFSRTAVKAKAMNISPKIMRGGTRL